MDKKMVDQKTLAAIEGALVMINRGTFSLDGDAVRKAGRIIDLLYEVKGGLEHAEQQRALRGDHDDEPDE